MQGKYTCDAWIDFNDNAIHVRSSKNEVNLCAITIGMGSKSIKLCLLYTVWIETCLENHQK